MGGITDASAGCAQESVRCARERILPANAKGPRSADGCAQALAAFAVRQVHHGPRIWVERGP
jgi:hypothetical protein